MSRRVTASRLEANRTTLSAVLLPGVVGLHDVSVEDGRVVEISSWDPGRAAVSGARVDDNVPAIEDLHGMLLLPALEEHHAHLDKALTADSVINRTGDLMGAIDAWIEAEESGRLGFDEMRERAERSLEQLVLAGVTRVRTHVNVGGSDPSQRNLRAVDAARRNFIDLIDVDIVALMHSPMAGNLGRENRQALDKAVEFGVDFIGGCPHLEDDSQGMISHILDVATAAGLPIDLHVDETLDEGMLSVELLSRAVMATGFSMPVTASHCVSLSVQDLASQKRLATLIAEANVRVVALPQTNLFLQGWDHPRSTPRGIAPLALLKDHGVRIAAGGDNVQDPFNPMGRHDPLETASLLVTVAHLDPVDALEAVVGTNSDVRDAKKAWIGCEANFLAIEADNIRSAIASGSSNRRTIRRGRIVARSSVDREILRSQ